MKTCSKCLIEKDNSCFNKHNQTKDGLGVWCKDCINLSGRERYALDPSKAKAYRDSHKEEAKAYSAIYRAENAEKLKADKAEYSRLNKDKIKEKRIIKADQIRETRRLYNKSHTEENRLYRLANKEHAKELKKIWKAANPDALRLHKINHRARKIGNGGKLSRGLRKKLFELQRGCCAICKKKLSKIIRQQHMDHVIALANGGPNEDWNMQLLCQPCNLEKHTKDNLEFMQSKGYLL